MGARAWHRRNGDLSLLQCPSIVHGPSAAGLARRARVGSARAGPRPRRERAQWHASALHAQATTRSEWESWYVGARAWRRRNGGLSLVQCPPIAYEPSVASAARRARIGSARAGPRLQRERSQWRASALHAQAATRSEREGWHVGRCGTIERARRDGATLGTMTRRCRAWEAGASPQARWVCCSPIDGGTTRFARDCQ